MRHGLHYPIECQNLSIHLNYHTHNQSKERNLIGKEQRFAKWEVQGHCKGTGIDGIIECIVLKSKTNSKCVAHKSCY